MPIFTTAGLQIQPNGGKYGDVPSCLDGWLGVKLKSRRYLIKSRRYLLKSRRYLIKFRRYLIEYWAFG